MITSHLKMDLETPPSSKPLKPTLRLLKGQGSLKLSKEWHWLVAFGHLTPLINGVKDQGRLFRNYFEREDRELEEEILIPRFQTSSKTPVTDEQKEVLMSEVKRHILTKMRCREIYSELYKDNLLPVYGGKYLSMKVIQDYYSEIQRELCPPELMIKNRIVELHSQGKSRDEIKRELNTTTHYVRDILVEAGIMPVPRLSTSNKPMMRHQIRELKDLHKIGKSDHDLAMKYEITLKHVRRIINGEIYKNV